MAQPSRLEKFLSKFPQDRRIELERQIRSAPDTKTAYNELRRVGYRYSYDSVLTWRNKQLRATVSQVQQSANAIASMTTESASGVDPVKACMNLADELNNLCSRITAMLSKHQWLEAGEQRLSNRDALKLLAALPSLHRASAGTVTEMHRVKTQMDEKTLVNATLQELAVDWQAMLEHDNPELVPLIHDAISITQARLETSNTSLLERYLNGEALKS